MRILLPAAIFFAALVFGGRASAEENELFAFIEKRDVAGLEAAFKDGADPNARQADGYKATPLMLAASVPDPAMVNILVAAGADVDARDNMGDPAINWATYYGYARVVDALLKAGADQTLVGHGNAVEIAMRRGHQAALAVLLAAKEPKKPRPYFVAALEASAAAGDLKQVAALLPFVDVAAAADWAGRPLIEAPARAGQAAIIELLVKHGSNVDAQDQIGFTPLFEAAREGKSDTVAKLLELGANPNHKAKPNSLSLTPLHLAAIGGDAHVVSQLVDAGAELNARGVTGATALMWAAFEGKQEAAETLLRAGADATVATPDGTTFRQVAVQRGWDEAVALADAVAK